MSKVTKGTGTKISYCTLDAGGVIPTTPTWVDIARVVDVSGTDISADDMETSNLDSVEEWKEFEPGWSDAGEITFKLQFKKTDAASVWALYKQLKGFQVAFSDGSKWACVGYVKKFGDAPERTGIVTTSATIKLSGKPVLTVAT